MHHDFYENSFTALAGFCTAMIALLLKMDMHVFYEQVIKSGAVLLYGAIGGAGGIIGKKIIEHFFKIKLFTKKKKRNP